MGERVGESYVSLLVEWETGPGIDELSRDRVFRGCEKLSSWPVFDNPSVGKESDTIRQLTDGSEVVGDQQGGHRMELDGCSEHGQDLSLHRRIECGQRFVEDPYARFGGECTSDADPLAFPSGELKREAVEKRLIEPDE